VAVKDTGIGITPEDLPRIFAPFTQGDSSTTRQYEGTGLGLYISKKLLNLMQGSIRAESQPGSGTTIYIEGAVAGALAYC
jgi:two-component system sensor histidine kinase/response regulator